MRRSASSASAPRDEWRKFNGNRVETSYRTRSRVFPARSRRGTGHQPEYLKATGEERASTGEQAQWNAARIYYRRKYSRHPRQYDCGARCLMVRLFASSLVLHSTGMSPWVDTAYAPSYSVDAVRPFTGEGIAAQFG